MDTKSERKPKWWHGGKFPGSERGDQGLALSEFAEDGGSNAARTRVDGQARQADADRYFNERGSGDEVSAARRARVAGVPAADLEERIPLALLGIGAAFVGALFVGSLVGAVISRRERETLRERDRLEE